MIESGRWRGLLREERRCRECQSGKIEAVHAPLVVGVSCMGHRTTTSPAVHEANNQ